MGAVREPVKKNSIEKKRKIIKKGFELMCKEGYHNVSCVDIAKYASVSTGIIYQYFKNKRDIFIEGIKDYLNGMLLPMEEVIQEIGFDKDKLEYGIGRILDVFEQAHTIDKRAHEELMAMSHLDLDIAMIFHDNEMVITQKVSQLVLDYGLNGYHLAERVHIIIGIVDGYCHEVVYHRHSQIDNSAMREEVIQTILFLLS